MLASTTSVCPSVVGATVGGGISFGQGIHGLLIDTLRSVRLVTASGVAMTVSPFENSDLFWAIRGAGASYGIITSATYEIFDLTNNGQVMVANFEFTMAAGTNGSVWRALKTFDTLLPANLALNIAVQFSAAAKQVRSGLPLFALR